MFNFQQWLRRLTSSSKRIGRREARRPRVEMLEDRLAPAAWVAQGPGPTVNAQVNIPLTDPVNGAIQSIAPHPTNADILYVGTGEANIFRASMAGVGVYKSTDAGKTFQHVGLSDTQTIGRIIVHPTNPDIVYVAAAGHEWTDNENRGIFDLHPSVLTNFWRNYLQPRPHAKAASAGPARAR